LNKQAAQEASRPRTFGALVEHYRSLEMPMETHDTKRRSTKLVYQSAVRERMSQILVHATMLRNEPEIFVNLCRAKMRSGCICRLS
jgi:hypothetical protein